LRPPAWWVELGSLLFIELNNWRWSWRSMLVTGTLAPVLSILALGIFARDSGPLALAYVFTGNLVLSLIFGNMRSIQSLMVFLRFRGTLDYFATLPVRRSMVLLAMVLAFLLLAALSLLVTLVLGVVFLHVPVSIHPLVLLVIPLCALPLSGIGVLIGAIARAPEEAGALNLVVTLLLTGVGPVIIPSDRLPGWLISLGFLSPATYAASALRQVLLGPLTPRLWLDVGMLVGLGVGIFWLVTRKLDWRSI
jgi:ABC-2 type transport system permease protein